MTMSIVFDLDGTLLDSAPDLQAALNKVLDEEGAAALTLAEVIGFIGHGIPNLVDRARRARGIDAASQPAMTERMFEHYLASPASLSRLFPGVRVVLEQLAGTGHPLGLCTNKALTPTMEILRAFNLDRQFAVVIGGDSLPQKKPDPAPLLAAFDALGGRGIYIGDSEVDAETAEAAQVPFGLFTLGYRHSPVEQLPHDFAFDDYQDLPGLLRLNR
ncbi:phosphoglycolate phosphatase [Tabrizicola sp. J26]|uniref:phosphoglycolate phosphatase n=1 Tax=Alitabrizicola rongguiensis TaxID=2909234 RepID=UPI001EEC90E7|nr:phosphoglycolate phosphatase [Tabrizicola rongguiensis]MCF1708982.1 phosphoglycolate phosphatase [Tabrizicola rongguiensis]